MFRPIRTIFLLLLVFFAGLAFEKYQHSDRCIASGGTVTQGLCIGARP